MTEFNRVFLFGNLTRKPELRYSQGGTAVTTFSIAISHRRRNEERSKDDVSFIDIVVYGKQAESCAEFLDKGRSVLVEGRLQQRRWETSDGQKKSKIEVISNLVHFMGSFKETPSEIEDEESVNLPQGE